MKKIALTLSVMAVFFATVQWVKAEETEVTYSEDSSYTIEIPKKIEISKDSITVQELKATYVNLKSGERLKIRATGGVSDGKVTLKKAGGTSEIQVIVSTGASATSGITVNTSLAEFINQSETPDSGGKIYFAAVNSGNSNVDAGSYKGTMTFTVETYSPGISGS